MSIGKVNGSGASGFDQLALSGIEDPLIAAAALQLSTEHEIRNGDELERQMARQEKIAADKDAVKHLLEKADDIRTGALTSLAFSAAGTAVQAYGASQSIEAADHELDSAALKGAVANHEVPPELVGRYEAGATFYSAEAKPSAAQGSLWSGIGAGISAGHVVGDQVIGQAAATEADARSQAAKTRADAAQSVVDTLKEDRKKSEEAVQTTLGLVREILDAQHQTAMAIVNRT